MRHEVQLQVGPFGFRVGSDWSAPIEALRTLYEGYPAPSGASDFTVRLEAERPWRRWVRPSVAIRGDYRSEEHTSELQSLMRISYAVFCLKKKKNTNK